MKLYIKKLTNDWNMVITLIIFLKIIFNSAYILEKLIYINKEGKLIEWEASEYHE